MQINIKLSINPFLFVQIIFITQYISTSSYATYSRAIEIADIKITRDDIEKWYEKPLNRVELNQTILQPNQPVNL